MSFWWMEPGWKDACCSRCGANIWDNGGDPDHGVCYDCFYEQEYPKEQLPKCDICGKYEAVTGTNGYGVCSEECSNEAMKRKNDT